MSGRLARIGLVCGFLVACGGEDGDERPVPDATAVPDMGAPDGTPDGTTGELDASGSGDATETVDTTPDAAPEWVPRPAPAEVSCDTRAIEGRVWSPPGCGYDVTHMAGIKALHDHCGPADASAPPSRVRLSFPDADASTRVAISWETGDTNRTSLVRIGLDPAALDRHYAGHSFTHNGLTPAAGPGRLIHEVHLCDLLPGRTWYYQVGGGDVWSEVESFTTAPLAGSTDEFVFAVAGDTRNEPSIWGEGLREMDARGAQFVVFSGDAVDQGPEQRQWDAWFDNATPWLGRRQFLMANGNHDLFSLAYTAGFAFPGNEMNYHVRYGNALFISLNDDAISGLTSGTGDFRVAGKAYLESVLEQYRDDPTVTWRFLVNHRAFYSASNHGSQEDIQRAWQPVIDAYGIDVVFNGHDHNYERSKPIRNGQVVGEGEGTMYVVAAGLGAPLYGNGTGWWTEISEKVSSYGIVTIRGGSFTFVGYRLDGTEIDRFTLTK